MDLPIFLKNKIESEANKFNFSDLKNSASNISMLYLNNNGENSSLVSKELDVTAYAITRMPATFGALTFAMEKMFELVDRNSIHTVLDIGSGTGTSIHAVNALINEPVITCVEREKTMIEFSKKFIGNYKVNYINEDASIKLPNVNADLVIASYFLNEIKEDNLENLLEEMWVRTNKHLLIVDPGTPASFNRIKEIRKYFLSIGAHVVAPCPHEYTCPIRNNDWCHFQTRVSRSKLHKLLKEGESPFEDEKFVYLVVSKEEIKPYEQRILRHPIINSGFITLSVCDKSGEILNRIVTKKDKNNFKKAKKSNSGDAFN